MGLDTDRNIIKLKIPFPALLVGKSPLYRKGFSIIKVQGVLTALSCMYNTVHMFEDFRYKSLSSSNRRLPNTTTQTNLYQPWHSLVASDNISLLNVMLLCNSSPSNKPVKDYKCICMPRLGSDQKHPTLLDDAGSLVWHPLQCSKRILPSPSCSP